MEQTNNELTHQSEAEQVQELEQLLQEGAVEFCEKLQQMTEEIQVNNKDVSEMEAMLLGLISLAAATHAVSNETMKAQRVENKKLTEQILELSQRLASIESQLQATTMKRSTKNKKLDN